MSRRLEFQAVILAGGTDSSRVYPLIDPSTSNLAFLPIMNRPLLYYQLILLQQAKFASVIIAISSKFKSQVDQLLKHYSHFFSALEIEVVPYPEDAEWESGLVLKHLAHRIHSDFFVISGDVVNEVNLVELANVHRMRDASCTMLLKEFELIKREKDKKETIQPFTLAHSQELESHLFFGLQPSGKYLSDHRVVLVKNSNEREDGHSVLMGRNLLVKAPRVVVHSDVNDSKIYLFKHWVIKLLCEGDFPSVSEDLIPTLVSLFQSDHLREAFAAKYPEMYKLALSSQSVSYALSVSSLTELIPDSENRRIQVFAHLAQRNLFSERITTFQSLLAVNMSLLEHSPSRMVTPWEPFVSETELQEKAKVRNVLLGKHVEIHASAQVINCVIGDNCVIQAKCKLNRCVLLANSVVKDDSELTYCIVGEAGEVGRSCKLERCVVAPKVVVLDGTNQRGTKQWIEFDDQNELLWKDE